MTRVAVAVEGWNAEAAIGFALAAREFASSVTLSSSRETVDGKDEIEVMTLGPEPDEEVLMAVDGRDEKDAFDALLARLLGVVEAPEDSLAVLIGPSAAGQETAVRPPESRVRPPGPIVGIIVGRAKLAEALREAATTFVPDRGGLLYALSGDQSPIELDHELKRVADLHPASPVLIFTDMAASSCHLAAMRLQDERADVEIVSGVNLPMLVRFLYIRERMCLRELIPFLRWTARNSQGIE